MCRHATLRTGLKLWAVGASAPSKAINRFLQAAEALSFFTLPSTSFTYRGNINSPSVLAAACSMAVRDEPTRVCTWGKAGDHGEVLHICRCGWAF